MLPREKKYKNGLIWYNLGVLKYVIANLKIEIFKDNKSMPYFLSKSNLDEHLSTKLDTFSIYKVGLGASPPQAEENLKNQTKSRLFLYFVFCFLAGLPKSPKL